MPNKNYRVGFLDNGEMVFISSQSYSLYDKRLNAMTWRTMNLEARHMKKHEVEVYQNEFTRNEVNNLE